MSAAVVPEPHAPLSPAEHFVAADALLVKAKGFPSPNLPGAIALVAQAQVHATLALARGPLAVDAYNPVQTREAKGDRL